MRWSTTGVELSIVDLKYVKDGYKSVFHQGSVGFTAATLQYMFKSGPHVQLMALVFFGLPASSAMYCILRAVIGTK